MKIQISWKSIILSILLCLSVGGIASFLTMDEMKEFSEVLQPPFTPKQIVFPIVWTILLILLGLGFGLSLSQKNIDTLDKERIIVSFSIQLTLFFCWVIWFFGLGWYGFSVLWLIGLIVALIRMMNAFRLASGFAARLQIPYLIWCLFALYLNTGVWWLNRS